MIIVYVIHLPLPEEEQGIHQISGKISTCEFFTVGKSNENNYGIHLTLDRKISDRIFSYNFKGERLNYFNSICDNKSVVSFSYFADRLFIRPQITYWLLEEPEMVTP